MINLPEKEMIAKTFCDDLWDCYNAKYANITGRVHPALYHIAVYQCLLSHRSDPGSVGRSLQLALIESFEHWYPEIEQARAIDWIDLNIEVLDAVQGDTGDYGYGYTSSGDFVRDYDPQQSWGSSINHQLFQGLPTVNSIIEESNYNQEVIRQIKNILVELYCSPLNAAIPGEQALFDLMICDISSLLVGLPYDASKAHQLDVYLYLFQSAVLKSNKSKLVCAQIALSIHDLVKAIQDEGSEPYPIDTFWKMGLGYSEELVKDYNQLVSILDSRVFTVHRLDTTDGFEVSVWQYPVKDETLQKIILRGDGRFELIGERAVIFDDTQSVSKHLMGMKTCVS